MKETYRLNKRDSFMSLHALILDPIKRPVCGRPPLKQSFLSACALHVATPRRQSLLAKGSTVAVWALNLQN